MNTLIRKVDIDNIDMNIMREAADIINSGGLVAFPTETVYGLGADGFNPSAAAKIYAVKGRPSDNPLILHIYDVKQLDGIVRTISATALKLMKAFWPGPMTLIFEKNDNVPPDITGGLNTVAIRLPLHPAALSFLRAANTPVAAPSANLSGRPSPTEAAHVIEDFDGKIPMIIDGGRVNIGLESTIIDVTGDFPAILRPGRITGDMIAEAANFSARDIRLQTSLITDMDGCDASETPDTEYHHHASKTTDTEYHHHAPKAPGMKYRHYAPKADFKIYRGSNDKVVSAISAQALEHARLGHRVGILTTDENIGRYRENILHENFTAAPILLSLGRRSDLNAVASNIYKALRDFDAADVEYIFGEVFEESGFGQAIMNRLIKAAGYNIAEAD